MNHWKDSHFLFLIDHVKEVYSVNRLSIGGIINYAQNTLAIYNVKDFGHSLIVRPLIPGANNRAIDTIASKGGFQSCEKVSWGRSLSFAPEGCY